MKRIITLFIIALFCFSLTSCATENKVTAEPFESMEISFTKMGMLATYDNLDELIEASSLIVIASPVNTFTDEAPTFLDINGNPVD